MTEQLSSLGEVISGYTFRGAIEHQKDGNFTVVQAKNLYEDGTVDLTGLTRIRLDNVRSKARLQDGDVLLSNRGVSRSAVYRGFDDHVIAASSLYLLRLHGERLLPEYLMVYLNSQVGQGQLNSLSSGAVIKVIPKKALLSLEVPILPIGQQVQVISIFQNLQSRLDLYQRKVQLHEQLAGRAIASLLSHS